MRDLFQVQNQCIATPKREIKSQTNHLFYKEIWMQFCRHFLPMVPNESSPMLIYAGTTWRIRKAFSLSCFGLLIFSNWTVLLVTVPPREQNTVWKNSQSRKSSGRNIGIPCYHHHRRCSSHRAASFIHSRTEHQEQILICYNKYSFVAKIDYCSIPTSE